MSKENYLLYRCRHTSAAVKFFAWRMLCEAKLELSSSVDPKVQQAWKIIVFKELRGFPDTHFSTESLLDRSAWVIK